MGSPKGSTPTPPAAPTATASLQEYIQNLPSLFSAEQQYQPQFAQLEQNIQQQLYPQTAGLQEQLAGQASEGMSSQLPDIFRNQVSDELKSQFGRNVAYNPLAQESYGIGMANATKNWQDYYRNMGLSLANRQPLAQGQPLTSSFTPSTVVGMNSNNYGTQANLYGQQSQNYWNQQNYSPPWANMLGTLAGAGIGAAGNYATMGMYGNLMNSTKTAQQPAYYNSGAYRG